VNIRRLWRLGDSNLKKIHELIKILIAQSSSTKHPVKGELVVVMREERYEEWGVR
jgi:hypothetical protein